jgi:Xaa-Pro aminopeptidase
MGAVTASLPRAASAMADAGIDALLVGPGADLRHLTGYHALAMERVTLLVARIDGAHTLIVPSLERARAEAAPLPSGLELVDVGETADPYRVVADRLDGLGDAPTLGVGDRLWAMFVLPLQETLSAARWVPASRVTGGLRMRKTPEELQALRRAGQAIDRVHGRIPELLRPGRSEAEVGRDIAGLIVDEGHDEASFVIVASGPNGASPHHETGERRLTTGDAVVVDIGGVVDGYCSDCTRNYVLGEPPDGYLQAYRALEAAQQAAVDAVAPGVTAEAVDAAARGRLDAAGYGDRFIHRTGHGIGLEVHEDPYIVAGNGLALEAGMVFSVEPGVYLPQQWGMRIEDIVVVTDGGVERLNTLDREAVVV